MSEPAPRADEATFAVYLDKWLAHEPELRLAQGFLARAFASASASLHCLEHELLEAAMAGGNATAGQAKLAWWLQEVLRPGAARHPVLRALPLDDAGRAAAARAAQASDELAALESVADTGALVAAFAAAIAPLACVRAQRAGLGAPAASALEALAVVRIVAELRHWPRFAAPERARVPLSLLARHTLDRVRAAQPAEAATAALMCSLLDELAPILERAEPSALAPLDAARVLAARSVLRMLRRHPLASHASPNPFALAGLVLGYWRLARAAPRVTG